MKALSKEAIPEFASVVMLLQKYPFLCEAFSGLWLSRQLIINADYLLNMRSSYDIQEFLFEGLLERNHASHGRPKDSDPLYSSALENIAIIAANLSPSKDFHFPDEKRVSYRDNDHQEVGVTRLLDHSGLVYRNPTSAQPARYEFWPSWIGPHLVQRRAHTVNCTTL